MCGADGWIRAPHTGEVHEPQACKPLPFATDAGTPELHQPATLGPGEPAHFLIFEADFVDEETMLAALGSEVGARVAADVPNYSPGGAALMHFAVPKG